MQEKKGLSTAGQISLVALTLGGAWAATHVDQIWASISTNERPDGLTHAPSAEVNTSYQSEVDAINAELERFRLNSSVTKVVTDLKTVNVIFTNNSDLEIDKKELSLAVHALETLQPMNFAIQMPESTDLDVQASLNIASPNITIAVVPGYVADKLNDNGSDTSQDVIVISDDDLKAYELNKLVLDAIAQASLRVSTSDSNKDNSLKTIIAGSITDQLDFQLIK